VLSLFAPGPNVIVVSLIGYQVATGNVRVHLHPCFPHRHDVGRCKDAPWRIATQTGLVPISIGLVAASAMVVAGGVGRNPVAVAIIVATAVVSYTTRLNPLWIFAAAALIGLIGLL